MLARIIDWSLDHRGLVLCGAAALALWGIHALHALALDAIPDLSDTQVIVKTTYPGQTPTQVEDEVTYPLTSALLGLPGVQAVRAYSMFGDSYVYVIFEDDTDTAQARTRVSEQLARVARTLPAAAIPALGPDASGVGWIYQYALVDRGNRHDAGALRALQDFFLKYELERVPGVAEVASVGGQVRQFQIEIEPARLALHGLTLDEVTRAIRDGNTAGSGGVVEIGRSEFMVATAGYLQSLDDFRALPLPASTRGTPLRLGDVARVQLGAAPRRGVTDLDGQGEVTGGIVIMQQGGNALATIAAVRGRLAELEAGLPAGVELVTTYDRAGVITRAVAHLQSKLVQESIAVVLVCLVFLLHLRSALVVMLTLPLGILTAIIVMHLQGVSANIMSLGGIAIAVGAMVDATIVMIENQHKYLERDAGRSVHWAMTRAAAREVGPTLCVSLLIITLSFLPVLTLGGQEGKLFTPLAYTKTYAMAASAALAVTLTPVLMGLLVRGPVRAERRNPVNRLLQDLYRPVLLAALAHPRMTLVGATLLAASTVWPLARMGSEFMPPLDEGDLLYMPTTLPGVALDEAANILQLTDRLIAAMPEVARVFGKAGRAETATDPAPLSMFETTIQLAPRTQWPAGVELEDLIERLDTTVRLPGLTNSWGYPIRTRIDMLATGVRSPLGIQVTGPNITTVSALAATVEGVLQDMPGTRTVFAERQEAGRYLEITPHRQRAARYGLSAADVRGFVELAIGGRSIGTVNAGRERYPISLRYPRAARSSLATIAASAIPLADGSQVTLGELATLRFTDGPAMIKSEDGRLTSTVYIDPADDDIGGYVARARAALDAALELPPGHAVRWTGQYTQLERARARLAAVSGLTLAAVLLLLHLHFRDPWRLALVALCMPLSLVGGLWLTYLLGYHFSVAVAVGFIALAGVAAEFGMVMLLYLDRAASGLAAARGDRPAQAIHAAVLEGALLRIRPKLMTVAVIVAGLVPIMLSAGTGADVMRRIAAPLLGGMVTAPLLSLFVVPVLYAALLRRGMATVPASAIHAVPSGEHT